jgi:hypothetical protein
LREKSREFQNKIAEMTEYIQEIEGQVALKDAKISNLRLENRKLYLYLTHSLKGNNSWEEDLGEMDLSDLELKKIE